MSRLHKLLSLRIDLLGTEREISLPVLRRISVCISLLMPLPATLALSDPDLSFPPYLLRPALYAVAVGVGAGALEFRLARRARQCLTMLAVGVLAAPAQMLILGDLVLVSVVFAGAGLSAAGDVNRVIRRDDALLLLRAFRAMLACVTLWAGIWLGAKMGLPFGSAEYPDVLSEHAETLLIVTAVPMLALVGMDATIILVARRRRARARRLCGTCGYDLTGNESGVCPECGQPMGAEKADTDGMAVEGEQAVKSQVFSFYRAVSLLLQILLWAGAILVFVAAIGGSFFGW